MNKAFCRPLVLVLLPFVISACGSSSALPASPSSTSGSTALTAEQIAGTWQLHSIQHAGLAEQPRPAVASYSLTFSGDRFSTRADCNSCSGSFTITGSSISVANAVACTRAACPTMAFENAYTSLLAGEHALTVTAGSMVWASSRGTLRFMR